MNDRTRVYNADLKSYKAVSVDGRQIRLHRHVMELHLGRKLLSTEIVHHINGNIWDNRLENLEITNRADHAKHHAPERKIPRCGSYLRCCICGTERYYCPRMYNRVYKSNYVCRRCYVTKDKK